MKKTAALLLFCLGSILLIPTAKAQEDPLAPAWETNCIEGGCILRLDVLRSVRVDTPSGQIYSQPNPKDDREYISVAVGVNNGSHDTNMVTFQVDPRAQANREGWGIIVEFFDVSKDKAEDAFALPFLGCDKVSCNVRADKGIALNSKAVNVNLVSDLKNHDEMIVGYMRNGRWYSTMFNLTNFRGSYKNLLANLK